MAHPTTLTVPPLGNLNQEQWDWLIHYRYADWTSKKAAQDAYEAEKQLQDAQWEQRQARRAEVIAQVKAMHLIASKAKWLGYGDPAPTEAEAADLAAAALVRRELAQRQNENLQEVYDAFYEHTVGEDWTEAEEQEQLVEQERALNHLLNEEKLLPFVEPVPKTEEEAEEEALERLVMRSDLYPEPELDYDPDDAYDDKLANGYLPWEDPDVPDEMEMPEDMARYYWLSDKCSEAQKTYLEAVAQGRVPVVTVG